VSRIKKNGTDVEVILDFETDFGFLQLLGKSVILEIPDLLAYWTIPG
jgi:hypothetical protein